jgi:gamma-butyrobetaine dioxygenase
MTNILFEAQSKIDIQQHGRFLTLRWPDGFESSFHYFWLRDNCRALLCSERGQREINPIEIPLDVSPQQVKINGEGQLEILWVHDDHLSIFELSWLRQHSYSNNESYTSPEVVLWDGTFDIETCAMDYQELQDDAALHKWLSAFQRYGFSRLRNVPTDPKEVLRVGEKVSYIYMPPCGSYFTIDGRVAKVNNLVFNNEMNKMIGMHTDDAYFDPVPPVQLQHCLCNELCKETGGGESTLVDGFKVVTILREQYPDYFQILATTPVKFRWKAYERVVPIIQTNEQGELVQICYSNSTLQPLRLPMDKMEAYYEAYCCLSKMLVSPDFQIQFRLQSGDLSMIDNYRLLHGRNAFSTDGVRYLSACYIGRDAIYSHLNTNFSDP